MSEVKGLTTIKYVRQGDTITCSLRSTFPLKQFITNGTHNVSPSFADNMPCIYPVVRSSLRAARVAVSASECKWKYNGSEITLGSNGLSAALGSIAAGTFKSEQKSIDGFSVPTLTICKDLASKDNIDTDTIEFSGIVNTGFDTMVAATIDVSIDQTDGEAYMAYISVNNGGVIDDATATLTAKAHLLIGGVEPTTGITYAWYKMVVTAGSDGWKSLGASAQQITIAASDINTSELYKCVVSYGGKSADAVIEVADETDLLMIYPNPTDGAGNPIVEELSTARKQIVYAPKVYKRGTTEEMSGYTFNYLLTNSSGNEIASQDGGETFAVTYSHAVAAGGDLTLIISAVRQ